MAAILLVLAGIAAWLEIHAMRRMARNSLRDAQAAYPIPPGTGVDEVLAETASTLAGLLDLQACWFEPFPFDALLARIEQGRIVVPAAEPGVAPCSGLGVELPVRANGLTLGRYVLIPAVRGTGVMFPPTARDQAIVLATQSGQLLAAALIDDESTRRFGENTRRVLRPDA